MLSESIADQVNIRSLHDRYADAVFRRDAHAWAACWAADGYWNLMGTEVRGRPAIRALWESAMQSFNFVAFFVQVGSLTIAGDRGHGRVYTHEVLEDKQSVVSRPIGRYDDIYARDGDGWLYLERRYELLRGMS